MPTWKEATKTPPERFHLVSTPLFTRTTRARGAENALANQLYHTRLEKQSIQRSSVYKHIIRTMVGSEAVVGVDGREARGELPHVVVVCLHEGLDLGVASALRTVQTMRADTAC